MIRCTHCGSDKTVKAGKTQANPPRQKYYCKKCNRFFNIMEKKE